MNLKPINTNIVITLGPMLDSTDFKTLRTDITYASTGLELTLIHERSDGTATATAITATGGAGNNDFAHLAGGYYTLEITAAQNNTYGSLFVRGICDSVLAFESSRHLIVPSYVWNTYTGNDLFTNLATMKRVMEKDGSNIWHQRVYNNLDVLIFDRVVKDKNGNNITDFLDGQIVELQANTV